MYPAYGTAALMALLDRPVSVLERWDALTAERRIVAIAASDAHARLSLRNLGEPEGSGSALHVPSYENTFRMFSNVLPSVTLSGDARQDADVVLAAIRDGRLYSVIDGLAGPGTLSFTATSGTTTVSFGDVLPNADAATVLRVSDAGSGRHSVDPHQGWRSAGDQHGRDARADRDRHASGRIAPRSRSQAHLEILPCRGWFRTRSTSGARAPSQSSRLSRCLRRRSLSSIVMGRPQHGPSNTARSRLGRSTRSRPLTGQQLSLRYALGGNASSSAFTAFVMPAGADLPSYDRLMFTGRANHPMRMSVQIRERGGAAGERWHRSVYLEPTAREITVSFDDMLPRGETSRPRPLLANVESVLFVLDTVNTPLGGNGTLWLDDVKYAK